MKCPRCDTSGALFDLCPVAYALYNHQAEAYANALRINTQSAWDMANAARLEYEQHIGFEPKEDNRATTD